MSDEAKVEISAEDKASAVFDKLADHIGLRMSQISGSGEEAVKGLDRVSGSVADLAHTVNSLGGSAAGVRGVSDAMQTISGSASDALGKVDSLFSVLKSIAGLGPELMVVAGAVAVGGAIKWGADQDDANMQAWRDRQKKREDNIRGYEDFLRDLRTEQAHARGEFTIKESQDRIVAREAARRAQAAARQSQIDKVLEPILGPLRNQLGDMGLSPGDLAVAQVKRQKGYRDLGTDEQMLAIASARRAAESLDLKNKEVDLQKQVNAQFEQQITKAQSYIDKGLTPAQKFGNDMEEIFGMMSDGLLTGNQGLAALVQSASANNPNAKAQQEKAIGNRQTSTGPNLFESRFATRAPGGLNPLEVIARDTLNEQRQARAIAQQQHAASLVAANEVRNQLVTLNAKLEAVA